jgi:hypothetical protein
VAAKVQNKTGSRGKNAPIVICVSKKYPVWSAFEKWYFYPILSVIYGLLPLAYSLSFFEITSANCRHYYRFSVFLSE